MGTPWDEEMEAAPKKSKRRRAFPMPVDDGAKPVIKIEVELDRVVDRACAAVASDEHTYQRDFKLVHVVRGDGTQAGEPLIRPMSTATIRVRLSASAQFAKYDKKQEAWVPSLPTDQVVRGLEDLGTYPSVRPLIGIAETPFPRPDGTIVQQQGYDAASAFLYLPSATFATVPNSPTLTDAHSALAELLEVVVDFPFAGREHRSAWLAMLLTLFVRPAVAGAVPAFGVSATTKGTGKTKLVDAVSLIFTGRESFKRPFAEDDKELRKVLTGALSDGDRLTVFDNVKNGQPVEGASLDNAITSTRWRDRELGTMNSISAANVTTIVFTGNGLSFGGDTVRRVIPIELEAAQEKPEDRTGFRHPDLFGWLAAERSRLVVATLTIIRAWFASGRPTMNVRPLGSFESWSQTVPAMIRWLGEPCPMLTRASVDAADEGRNALAELLEGWERIQGDGSLTAAQVIRELYPPPTREERPPEPVFYDDMRSAIETLTGQSKPTSVKLSGVLRTNKRRICEKRHIDTAPGGRSGIARWKVTPIGLGGVGGDDGVSSSPLRGDESIHSHVTRAENPTDATNPTTLAAEDFDVDSFDPEAA